MYSEWSISPNLQYDTLNNLNSKWSIYILPWLSVETADQQMSDRLNWLTFSKKIFSPKNFFVT